MMTEDRIKTQIWVDTERSVLQEAKKIADVQRMTFGGFVGNALKEAVKKAKITDGGNSDKV